MSKLIVSLSPHAHGNDSVERNMYGVMIALLPALLVSLWFFGLGSAIVCATSVIACVFFEWAINKYILGRERNTVLDGSAALTGLLLGFNLPSNLPIWIIIIGALVAIGVGKMTFGGLGQNIFNPALVLDYLEKVPDAMGLMLGNGYTEGVGTVGELCALALLAGFAYMLWKKIITWHIPVSIIGTIFVLAGLFHLADPVYADPFTVILSGGLMLGAIFMATDYVTSPMTPKGQIIYGVSIGVLTLVIRNWGSYPEGMSFAILIMNAFTPLINMYVKPKRFGEVPKK